jgi:hypothetical protein
MIESRVLDAEIEDSTKLIEFSMTEIEKKVKKCFMIKRNSKK